MSFPVLTPLAEVVPAVVEVGHPLFGSVWLALLAVLGAIAGFLVLVALLGRWLAATHPDTPAYSAPISKPEPVVVVTGISPEITAVIAASIASVLGAKARIAAIQRDQKHAAPSVEMLMQQWSMEGRRQIYSSHKVR